MQSNTSLQGTELLHLAIEASGRQDHGAAISYLKQALDLPAGEAVPSQEYAKYLYLLGAEYAQIGMMDRAADHMNQAIDMDPQLHTARFQLGLLYLTCNQPAQALSTLAPLEKLPEDAALHHLGQGLQHLIQDQFSACRESLLKGIELNSHSAAPNLALNADMQKLLAALDAQAAAPQGDAAQGTPEVEAGYMMSAYHRSNQVN